MNSHQFRVQPVARMGRDKKGSGGTKVPISKRGFKVARVIAATSNIFFSLLLGAVALAVVAVQWPGVMEDIINVATGLKDYLTNTGLASKYNVWIKFLLQEQQLVFMGFVIVTRIILAILIAFIFYLFTGRSQDA